MYGRKWKPSKKAKEEFKEKMNAIELFLSNHLDVNASSSRDSFYFSFENKNYRISNHSIESSNARAYSRLTDEQVREKYHDDRRNENTQYIHASKTRIIEIYNAITSGKKVDGHGNVIE